MELEGALRTLASHISGWEAAASAAQLILTALLNSTWESLWKAQLKGQSSGYRELRLDLMLLEIFWNLNDSLNVLILQNIWGQLC